MESGLLSKIVEILKEKNYNIAAEKLKKIDDLDKVGTENFLYDIILERWVYRPKDIPFMFARGITDEVNIQDDKVLFLLKQILEYPIADINKAKINDFLWVIEQDFKVAKSAVKYYHVHIKNTEEFDYNFMAINRLIFISKKIRSSDINESIRQELLVKVLNQYKNEDHGKILCLIKTAIDENVDINYLLQFTEKILNTYDNQSHDYDIIGKFCDILEQLYCKKNKWSNKKVVSEPKLVEIRRRKIQAIMMAKEFLDKSNFTNIMQSVDLLKNVVKILKTIVGTEAERKEILGKIDELEKKIISNMPVFSTKQDNSKNVERLVKRLKILNKEEAICYFALYIPLPQWSKIEESVMKSTDDLYGFSRLFPIGILGKDGKTIAKSKPIKKINGEIDTDAFQYSMEQRTAKYMEDFSQIVIVNALKYIRSQFEIKEKDIEEIIENSVFVPEDRRKAYIKGIMMGFSGDFLTALCILVPQVENSIRELAVECGEPTYNLNGEGIEEVKTMHAILELEGVKECLDEDFMLAIRTIFCSKFGFNMRNDIAHGLLSDKQFQSYYALYTWWFILKMCYMFCGELQVNNRTKVEDKLCKLFEENNK